jgi:two-component system LytT family response regulator
VTARHGENGLASPIRVVLVDDEALARDLLRELLAAHPDIEIVAECANGFEAVKTVQERPPDLLLLDVQMPKLDGFDVLELLGGTVPVIFTTAYDHFALRAFDVHAVDYLLKPFGADRLAEALDRARERIRAKQPMPLQPLVAAARTERGPLSRILIRDRADVHVIPVERIDFIEAQDDYVSVKVGPKSYLKEQTLSELEGHLDPGRFVRIHRRFLLNLTRLAKIELSVTESRVAILHDGTELPISRTGYARLKTLL